MNHCDAEISEIIVCLTADYAERLDDAVHQLESAGMTIASTDDDNSVVQGEIDTRKLAHLHKLPCVSYIRTVFTYLADYPPGDPRDLDGPDAESPAA